MLTILTGDAIEQLRTLPDESVQCCVTSPPYWGLRDYGTGVWEGGDESCAHVRPDGQGKSRPELPNPPAGWAERDVTVSKSFNECKCGAKRIDSQLGLEKTPEEYVAKMVEVFRQVRRVLRKDGTLWLNLGDAYAHSGACGGGSPLSNPTDGRIGDQSPRGRKDDRIAQLKTGGTLSPDLKPKDLCGIPWRVAFALQADGWWLRAEVIWAKPNPMPESVTDRPTRSHESVFLLTKSARYFYDADAVREADVAGHKSGNGYARVDTFNVGYRLSYGGRGQDEQWLPGGGRNLRDVWNIATEPFPEAHFATFPKALAEPCIKAGCPVDGTVLDPFAGSGTTGVVASMLGRSFVGIELNPTYAEMARRRIANWRREYATTPAPKVLNGQSDLFDLSESLR